MSRALVPIILCGGSGSRMWPLSRNKRPKQLLPLTGDLSLFQETVQRLDGLAAAAPTVVCSEDVRFAIRDQLAELGQHDATLIVEPVGRNTAPAAAVAAHLADRGDDPLLLVLPSDHHIVDPGAFQQAIAAGIPLAEDGALVVFGVQPHKPETGYGYVQRGQPLGAGFEVARFVEKPDRPTARRWLQEGGYWWNSGMFLFRASRYLEELERFAPRLATASATSAKQVKAAHGFVHLDASFADCPSDSIDYAVMERTERAAMVPLDAGWSDLGSWSALWEVSHQDPQGNATVGDAMLIDTHNSYVRAGHRLVVAVGLDDHVVIETADAVLVTPKSQVQKVRDVVDRLKAAGRSEVDVHTAVERPWGTYEVLATGPDYLVKRLVVKAGEGLSLQFHAHRAERWTIVRGEARTTIDGEVRTLGVGATVDIPVGVHHRLENTTDALLTLIEVQVGDVEEADIVRLLDRYGRASIGVTGS